MPLCYFCGKETETYNCPHCNIKFCAEHLPPEKHNCIAYKETSSFDIPEKPKPIIEPIISTGTTPVESPKHQHPQVQAKQKKQIATTVILVAVSLVSIIVVILYATAPQMLPGIGPTTIDYELHSVALGQVNVYRYRNDLPDLSYNADTLAQEFADSLARTGVLEHNPNLPSNTGENVAMRSEGGQDPKVSIALMIQDMVNNDDAQGGVNRANILSDQYTKLSIGVAIKGDTVYLVLNFH